MSESSYDRVAEWYDESIRAGSLLHDLVTPALFNLMGNVQGEHICDLACGQGVLSRQLARCGARVAGVDLSAKLLEIARRDEESEPLGIVYLQGDVQELAEVEDAAFDGVACNMALMDIPDLRAVFRTVRRILRPGGWFVFSITHPCFQTSSSRWLDHPDGTVSREISGYFEEGFWRSDNPKGVRGQVGAYHRTLSSYVNALTEAGLVIEQIAEPRAEGEVARRIPGYSEVPAVLVARCRSAYSATSARSA